jgi:hypothetical protein
LLPCSAVAAEEFSLQVKLMLLWPLPDLISSLAHIPFSRHSQYNAEPGKQRDGERMDDWLWHQSVVGWG